MNSLDSLRPSGADFLIPNYFCSIICHDPLRDDLIAADRREDLGPERPIDRTKDEHTDSNNREDIIGIAFRIPISIGWNKWYNGEEDIGQQIENRYWQEGMPGRCPGFGFAVMQVNQTCSNKRIDPCSRICVPVHVVSGFVSNLEAITYRSTMKLYAGPAGGATKTITVTIQ